MTQPPSEEDRLLAALAHAGILLNAFNLLGLVGAMLIWLAGRERSAYIRHHTVQAVAFQVVTLLLFLVATLAWGFCFLLALLPAFLEPELYHLAQGDLPLTFWFVGVFGLLLLAVGLGVLGYGLYGAWMAWNGQLFTYALLGQVVQRWPRSAPSDTSGRAATPAPPLAENAPTGSEPRETDERDAAATREPTPEPPATD